MASWPSTFIFKYTPKFSSAKTYASIAHTVVVSTRMPTKIQPCLMKNVSQVSLNDIKTADYLLVNVSVTYR